MPVPATFWRRYAAYSLDLAIVAVIAFPLVAASLQALPAQLEAGIVALQQRMWDLAGDALLYGDLHDLAALFVDDPQLRGGIEALAHVLLDAATAAVLTVVAIAAVWFVGFEGSARRATPGKAALGLRVAAAEGGRPSFGRVLGRFAAGTPSWLLLHVGHAMAALRQDRRALHDLLAGTRVEQDVPAGTPLPTWARWWLAAQLAAAVALPAWAIARYAQLLAEATGLG